MQDQENTSREQRKARFIALLKARFADLLGDELPLLDQPEGLARVCQILTA